MSQIPERRAGWVFDKTVNVPTVFTIAAFAFAIIRWGGGIEADISMLKAADANRKESQAAIVQSQDKLDTKMDQGFRELRQVMFAVQSELTKKK